MKFVAILIIAMIVEFLYASHLYAVQERQPLAASALGMAGYILHAAILLTLVENGWQLIPASAGFFSGTWLRVRIQQQEVSTP